MLSKLARVNALHRIAMRRLMSTEAAHHEPNPDFWRKVFLYVSVPAIILSTVNTILLEKEHYSHWHKPPFVPYEYMRVRVKRFPWGDGTRTLFHNPNTNALATGWEEVPESSGHSKH